MGGLPEEVYRKRRRVVALALGPEYKKGCTGKVFHGTMGSARSAVYIQYMHAKGAQAYRCRHCPGWHITTTMTARKTQMICPAIKREWEGEPPENKRAVPMGWPHVYKLRRLPDKQKRQLVASCIHCAIRIYEFTILLDDERDALRKAAPPLEIHKRFRESIARMPDRAVICLSEDQRKMLGYIIDSGDT
jgi:hypothetical protein